MPHYDDEPRGTNSNKNLHFPNPVTSGKIKLVAEGWGEPEVIHILDGQVVRILDDLVGGGGGRSADGRWRVPWPP